MYANPTVLDFKQFFNRDFPYTDDIETGVTDTDISNAQFQAVAGINPDLFCDQGVYSLGFNLLSAHYLVMSIRNSSQGMQSNGQNLQSGRSVGSVSESLAIPQRILDNPEFAFLYQTGYGQRYLAMVLPQLSGVMTTVAGTTRPFGWNGNENYYGS